MSGKIKHTASGFALILGATFIIMCGKSAEARPEYARKEGLACQYCHVSGSPNSIDAATGRRESTMRNERGIYYGSHNHSFAGYVEKSEGNTRSIPKFRLAWYGEFMDAPRRMAIADVVGDGTVRLVTLNEKPDNKNAGTLMVKRWNGKTFITEFTGDLQTAPDKLAVGKFAGSNRPAVIVTGDALWFWNGTTFEHKPASHPIALFGATRLKEGGERVLIAESPTDIKAYRVDIGAKGGDWLIDKISAPTPFQVLWGDMHTTPEGFQQMGVNEVFGSGGLVGIWDVWKSGTYFLYHADRDYDLIPDPNNKNQPKIVYNNQSSTITFSDRGSGGALWTSPKLSGIVYDLAIEDPKASGKPGFAVLSSTAPGSKGRSIYFFTRE
jgi:hypothetical protein